MATPLLKCLSLEHLHSETEVHPNHYLKTDRSGRQVNADFAIASGTPWIRLWAFWHQLAPTRPSSAIDQWNKIAADPNGYLDRLEREIQRVNSHGKQVILCLKQYAPWANSTDPTNTDTRRLPLDVTTDGPWAHFLGFLILRLGSPSGNPRGARIHALELMNEPNLPNVLPSTNTSAQPSKECSISQMITTADAVANYWRVAGYQIPTLLAPSLADTGGHATFGRGVLDLLDISGWQASGPFLWSHHNYLDVELNRQSGVESVRENLLACPWTGRSDKTTFWLTEGGCEVDYYLPDKRTVDTNPSTVPSQYQLGRQILLQQNWNRMKAFPGCKMWTNHLINNQAENSFDSGLFENYNVGLNQQGAITPGGQAFRDTFT